MPAASQAVAGELTLTPAGPARVAAQNCESQAAGPRGFDYVGMQSHSMARVEIRIPAAGATARRRRVPRSIRATMPWRAAAASIRARTACSSMGLSNSAARLATSAAAIAPPSHHRRP